MSTCGNHRTSGCTRGGHRVWDDGWVRGVARVIPGVSDSLEGVSDLFPTSAFPFPPSCFMRRNLLVAAIVFGWMLASAALAADRFGEPVTVRHPFGVKVQAAGALTGVVVGVPLPKDWPEQQIKLVKRDQSPHVLRATEREVGDGARMASVSFSNIAPGQSAHAIYTFEITRRRVNAPTKPEAFRLPQKLNRELRAAMAPSPFIESRSPEIAKLADELTADKQQAWEIVKALFDFVHTTVKYDFGNPLDLKGGLATLRDKKGDCEGMTSLFVALCRARGIPARAVWVPGHTYAEFYLEDARGQGYWLPCDATSNEFGGVKDIRPILQKGDNFRYPDKNGPQRYVLPTFRCSVVGGGGDPRVEFIGPASH